MELVRVAGAAWEMARKGTTSSFMSHRVVKHSNYLVVMPRLKKWRQARSVDTLPIVIFPDPKHFEHFRKAVSSTREDGPGYDHPGGIGTVRLRKQADELSGPHLELLYAQAHFKVGTSDNELPRSLATRYGGWRVYALREALKMARLLRKEVWIHKNVLKPPGNTSDRFSDEVERVSKQTGFDVLRMAEGVWIVPKH